MGGGQSGRGRGDERESWGGGGVSALHVPSTLQRHLRTKMERCGVKDQAGIELRPHPHLELAPFCN